MHIYVSAKSVASNAGANVNRIGKYLMKHIDGAYSIKFLSMTCEVLMKMYYQIEGDANTFNEMDFEINITSYQNKIRVNLTEITETEKTIAQVILKPEEVEDLNLAKKRILSTLRKAIAKEFDNYIFVF